MRKQYHILNGDALAERFPLNIEGDIIVARECLVEGNVKGRTLEELFTTRATFLSQNYGGTEQDYYLKVVPEFQKILATWAESDINLWFEDDLFCQVNFWFITSLLQKQVDRNVFLVRPATHTTYGFGGLSESDLITIYKHRVPIKKLDKVASLWGLYQADDTQNLLHIAKELVLNYPFILAAVQAHIERNLTNELEGRPIQTILRIMTELETQDFAVIFREFNKRESIYGFGDSQVKRLFDIAIKNRK